MPAQQQIFDYMGAAQQQGNLAQSAANTIGNAVSQSVDLWQQSQAKAGHVNRVFGGMSESLKKNLDDGVITPQQYAELVKASTPTEDDINDPKAYGQKVANIAANLKIWDETGASTNGLNIPDVTRPYTENEKLLTEKMAELKKSQESDQIKTAFAGQAGDTLPADQAGPVRPAIPAATSNAQVTQNLATMGADPRLADNLSQNMFPKQVEPPSELDKLKIETEKLNQDKLKADIKKIEADIEEKKNKPKKDDSRPVAQYMNQTDRALKLKEAEQSGIDVGDNARVASIALTDMSKNPDLKQDEANIQADKKIKQGEYVFSLIRENPSAVTYAKDAAVPSQKVFSVAEKKMITQINLNNPSVKLALEKGFNAGIPASEMLKQLQTRLSGM